MLNIGMRISKDTPEGKRLGELIEINKKNGVNAFIARITCENLSTGRLIKAIEKKNEECFEMGKKAYERAKKYYSIDTVFSQLMMVWEQKTTINGD